MQISELGLGLIQTRKGGHTKRSEGILHQENFRFSEMARNAFRILCLNNNSVIITVIHWQ